METLGLVRDMGLCWARILELGQEVPVDAKQGGPHALHWPRSDCKSMAGWKAAKA
ncbi:unnamed protein product [Prunus armeniaca]